MHCMCSLERNFECTGGLWRPEIGSLALLASFLSADASSYVISLWNMEVFEMKC